jgi:hypothetical protein
MELAEMADVHRPGTPIQAQLAHFRREAPDEVLSPPEDVAEYQRYRRETDFREPYR